MRLRLRWQIGRVFNLAWREWGRGQEAGDGGQEARDGSRKSRGRSLGVVRIPGRSLGPSEVGACDRVRRRRRWQPTWRT